MDDPKREIHFGILALQLGLINREQLLAAIQKWHRNGSESLDELLRAHDAIGEEDRRVLWAMIDRLIKNHNSDAAKSLGSLTSLLSDSVLTILSELRNAAPPELGAPLSLVGREKDFAKSTILEKSTVTTIEGRPAAHGPRFRIIRPHARGGLGEISVAEDVELHREIALKEIQARYADDPLSRLRFVLEAEVTGGLEHPGIVPVYGLGQHDDGRPFYAMRFIRGDSLQDAIAAFHADRANTSSLNAPVTRAEKANNNLQLRKLLGRFIDVCMAISYAHSRGVLHRDLKPGNVMLGKYGETLVVDWGLARVHSSQDIETPSDEKLLQPASGSGMSPTVKGSIVGTPAYMPPEQASGDLESLGPASDVYSLGATLFHLLTGQAPFQGKDLASLLVNVREGKFPAPREVLAQVPPPLEAVCLKAMALRPEERYASPEDLAEEIERYLADEPVTSHRETLWVHMRRWSRKHPRSVAALATTLFVGLTSSLLIAVVVAGKNQQLAEKNRDLDSANIALAAKNEELARANTAERLAKEFAEAKRLESESATDYMVEAFRKADPAEDGLETKVVDVIDQAVKALEIEYAESPLLRAKLLNAFGQTYRGIGLPQECLAVTQQAYDLRREHLGENHEETLKCMASLALAHETVGDVAKAISMHQDCLARLKSTLGDNHPSTLSEWNNLGLAYDEAGNTQEALKLLQECLLQKQNLLGESDPSTLTTWNNVATCYVSAGQYDAALEIQKKCLELTRETLGEKHVDTLTAVHGLALTHKRKGDLLESIRLNELCLEARLQILGEDHPHTLSTMNNLAVAYKASGFLDKALPLYSRSYEARKGKLGEDHPSTLTSLNNLANGYMANGKPDQALPLFQQCWEKNSAVRGVDHPSTLTSLNNLAVAHDLSGQPEQALELYERSLQLTETSLGETHPLTLLALNNLANVFRKSRRIAEAIEMHLRCHKARQASLGEDHPDTLETLNDLAHDYESSGDVANAIPIYLRCLELRRVKLGEDHPQTLNSMNNLAVAYNAVGSPEMALPIIEECQTRYQNKLGENHPFTLTSLNNFGNALRSAGRLSDSIRVHQECLKKRRDTLGQDHVDTLRSIENLVKSYIENKQLSLSVELIDDYLKTRTERQLADDTRLADLLANISGKLNDVNEFALAERYLRRCLMVQERDQADKWTTFNTRSLLGGAILGQAQKQQNGSPDQLERMALAEQLLLDGYKGMRQRESDMNPRSFPQITAALESLVRFYEASQQTASAEEWRKNLEEWRKKERLTRADRTTQPLVCCATQEYFSQSV